MRWLARSDIPCQDASLPTPSHPPYSGSIQEPGPKHTLVVPPEIPPDTPWAFDASLVPPIVHPHSSLFSTTSSAPVVIDLSPDFPAHQTSNSGSAPEASTMPSALPGQRPSTTSPFDILHHAAAEPSSEPALSAPPPRPPPIRSGSTGSRPPLAPIVTGPILSDTPAGPLSGLLLGSGLPGLSAICNSAWLAEPVLQSPVQAGPDASSATALLEFLNTTDPFSSLQHPAVSSTSKNVGLNVPEPPVVNPGSMSHSPSVSSVAAPSTPIPAPAPGAQEQVTSAMAPVSQSAATPENPQALTAAVARQIWQYGIGDSFELPFNLARAAAVQLITYPALMVLPEPTSPVPPFIFRPWLAQIRSQLPESLAVCRSVLAGYLVRLPSSLGMVWRNIAHELQALIFASPQVRQSDDVNLFASTAALWLYLVLALLSDEDAAKQHIDDDLINAGLHALSQLGRALSDRVRARDQSVDKLGMNEWGLLESMRRTLFAAYILLVLQRLRAGVDPGLRRTLAGAELVLDVILPAPAAMFAAATEGEWASAHLGARLRVQCAMRTAPGSERFLTLRDLVGCARAAAAHSCSDDTERVAGLFSLADDFTKIVLAVSLGLDSGDVRNAGPVPVSVPASASRAAAVYES